MTDSTKMTLSCQYGEVSVSVNEVDLTLEDLVSKVIVPTLQAAGYQYETITRVFRVKE